MQYLYRNVLMLLLQHIMAGAVQFTDTHQYT